MAALNYSVLPVETADEPILAEFLHSLKQALTINRLLFKDWPNDAVQKPLYRAAVKGSGSKNIDQDSFKVVDEYGVIVGHLTVTRRRPKLSEQLTDADNGRGQKDILKGLHPDVLAAVNEAVTEIVQETAKIDHFEVTYIGVEPTSRRRGIGSRLLQEGFVRAKAENLPLTVAAEPEARDFFVKLGFRDTVHADIDLAQWAAPNSGFGNFRLSGMIWYP